MDQKVVELQIQIERLKAVVTQLLRGLFNQEKQSNILNMHLAILNGEDTSLYAAETDEDIWPTTRQGDALLKQLQSLQEEIAVWMKTKT